MMSMRSATTAFPSLTAAAVVSHPDAVSPRRVPAPMPSQAQEAIAEAGLFAREGQEALARASVAGMVGDAGRDDEEESGGPAVIEGDEDAAAMMEQVLGEEDDEGEQEEDYEGEIAGVGGAELAPLVYGAEEEAPPLLHDDDIEQPVPPYGHGPVYDAHLQEEEEDLLRELSFYYTDL